MKAKDILPPHLDPIQRDLLVVFAAALAIAATIISAGFVLFH
jgi:hypothetical protein